MENGEAPRFGREQREIINDYNFEESIRDRYASARLIDVATGEAGKMRSFRFDDWSSFDDNDAVVARWLKQRGSKHCGK